MPDIERSYGWMPSPPDFRDRYWFAPDVILEALPQNVDLSRPSPGKPWDPSWSQGSLGSCGPHAMGADIVFAQFADLKKAAMPSRLFMYYNARAEMGTIGQDSGVYNRAMLKSLADNGWCDEDLWPYEISKFKSRPPPAAYEQAATRKGAIQYLRVIQDLNQMKACIAGGDPFIFGFSVYSSMETGGVDKSGDIPMPGQFDRMVGGHDVLIVGYDDFSQRFKLKNSWGPWGLDGYGTIPYSYATNSQLATDFWTVRKAGILPPPNPPDPSPPIPPGPLPPVPPNPTPDWIAWFIQILVKVLSELLKDMPPSQRLLIAQSLAAQHLVANGFKGTS